MIGAASRNHIIAQPRPVWIEKLVARCAIHDIPVFMKGNLKGNKAVQGDWLEQFPQAIAEPAPVGEQKGMF